MVSCQIPDIKATYKHNKRLFRLEACLGLHEGWRGSCYPSQKIDETNPLAVPTRYIQPIADS